MDIKLFIANTIVKRFKAMGCFGAARFWTLYWCYKITGWHIRPREWDFVLEYLPKLTNMQNVYVLDIGSTSSLFIYELIRRGYNVTGLDLRTYQEKPPFSFIVSDITRFKTDAKFDFIVCISVLEHVNHDLRREAFRNMMDALASDGRLILTIPTHEYAHGHPWRGFSYENLMDYMNDKEKVLEYTEHAGQICVVITKIDRKKTQYA
jgi:SAM-dependent methyltransferase